MSRRVDEIMDAILKMERCLDRSRGKKDFRATVERVLAAQDDRIATLERARLALQERLRNANEASEPEQWEPDRLAQEAHEADIRRQDEELRREKRRTGNWEDC